MTLLLRVRKLLIRVPVAILVVLVVAISNELIAQTISTVAGSSLKGDGGLATGANLNNPAGIAIDGDGNLYIADQNNHKVRKVSTGGIISTVAGVGVYGFSGDGGTATAANLASPKGVAVDGNGNLYIADSENNRIRKVSTTGTISTVAGDGTASYGGDGGAATAASLNKPTGIAVDGAGNLYIADSENNRIRKVSAGVITTIAGSGTASFSGDGGLSTTATLNKPVSVTIDGSGNVYIADLGNQRIRKVSTSGIITTIAGNGTANYSGDGGVAIAASLNNPMGVGLDGSGNIYIADQSNHRIRIVSAGIISTVAGNGTLGFGGDGGAATAANLYSPAGVMLDGSGNLYIADQSNYRIRKVSAGVITTVVGNGAESYGGDGGAATSASLFSPFGVVVDGNGNRYIADQRNHRIRKIATSGIITTVAGNGTYGSAGDGGTATTANLANPAGLALDAAGNLYIADQSNHKIRKVSTGGIISTVAGNGISDFSGDGGLATNASLNLPAGVAVDGAGNLYIADSQNNRVRKVSTSGIITTIVGSGSAGFGGDGGLATSANIFYPASIALDGTGNLYFADQGNNRIRKVSTAGSITTVAGNSTQGFGGDGGLATSANLNNAGGIALDGIGNLYIADQDNNRVRKVSNSGIITTIAGTGDAGFSGDGGSATSATLDTPINVTVDFNRNIYITDSKNNRVRKILGPPIVRINPSDPSPVCSASTFSLTATPANFAPSSYSWVSQPTGLTATGATPTFTASTVSTPTVYTLTVTATNGASSATASVTVTINPTPASSLSITATPSTTLTSGQSNTLTASGASTYVWSTSATTASIVINTPGVYSVTGTALGCSAQKSITIYDAPTVRINPANPAAVCSAGTFSLTATPANFTPIAYAWSSQPAGLTATGTTPTFTAPIVSIPTVYTLTVTATNGSVSPTASVTLTVNPTPAASLSITAIPSQTLTSGQSNTLTASGATTYVWSTSATTASIVINTPGVYSVTGTALGCSAQKSITIYDAPIVRINPANPAAVCSAGTFSLTAIAANFTPTSYRWVSQPAGLTATGATPTFTAPTINTPTVYTLTVTATNGIASPTASVTLTVNPTPAANLSIAATPSLTVTGGQSNTLTASGVTSYVWSTGATSSSIAITSAGVYSVTGTALGCSAQKSITIYGNIASVQDGNWSTASTWNCNCVPTIYDTVTISVSHHVTVSQTVRARYLKQFGTLLFNSSGQILF